ncbi:hypothetical protein [Pedomonas mirosovicensis]|uniref:hypothetical protein n=1 Tax=Pedomonas mirosovicensis TaxID=2908641 RepID=UPI002166ED81|nr:hypothetical protein [Pedomonas mirosovicensis]MCH8684326.1 hypothetical protein [Pedomonas mirosovicensis]
MTRLDQGTGRLSLRNSILVWVAGIVIGWGCAVVLFYQLIRDSSEERGANAAALMASSEEAVGVADIAPAAGGASDTEKASSPAKPQARQSASQAEQQLR